MKAIRFQEYDGPEVLRLEDAAKAHRQLEARETTGKVVLLCEPT